MKSEKFKQLEKELEVLTEKLRKTEKMLSKAVAMTKGKMNRGIKDGAILELPVLVPYGDDYEFEVINRTPTGMLDVKSTTNPRVIIRVTFDIKAHEPLYDIVFEMMRLYSELEEEKGIMNKDSVDLSKFRK